MDALISRHNYSALDDTTYLNQASLGLIPAASTTAMTEFLNNIAQHGNVRLSDEAEAQVLDQLRADGAELLDTTEDRIAVTGGASEALNHACSLLATPDGTVVLVATDFPAVTYPWLSAASRLGMSIRWVDDAADTSLTENILATIDSATTVVCVSAVQYATGTAVDVRAIADRAHSFGASLVVDATQAAGAAPVSIADWTADAVVTSGYKWLSGHGGAALFAVNERLLDTVPAVVGWMGSPNPFDFDARHLKLDSGARRFELSTISYSSAVGLSASIRSLLAAGIPEIANHAAVLSYELVDATAKIGWSPFRSAGQPGASSHIVSLGHPVHDALRLRQQLAQDHDVYVSSRGNRLRVSLHAYNNSEDIDRLAAVLREIA